MTEHSTTKKLKPNWIIILLLLLTNSVFAQRFVSKEGLITFFSDAPIEDISAINKTTVSLLDFKSGDVAFLVKVRDFNFDKALMQEHFKEKYIEADKYPRSEFKGKFTGFDPSKSGKQQVEAEGVLTIKGVAKPIKTQGIMEYKDNMIFLDCQFKVKLEDYKIEIPQILWQNIAEEILITVDFTYRPYEK